MTFSQRVADKVASFGGSGLSSVCIAGITYMVPSIASSSREWEKGRMELNGIHIPTSF
jgi:hypothetical protein